jgi:hypothetical protein
MYAHTVRLLRHVALFREREEDLLCGWLGNGAFKVCRDVDSAVWAVYLFGPGISVGNHWCVCDEPA